MSAVSPMSAARVNGYVNESCGTLGAHVQMGTEFVIAGPVSIRADVFMLVRFTERTFGPELAKLDTLSAFGAGAVVMGVWSFE